MALAVEEAELADKPSVGTGHILTGLVREGEGMSATVLGDLGCTVDSLRQHTKELSSAEDDPTSTEAAFTRKARRSLDLAEGESRDIGHGYVGTEHLLLGLLREGDCVATQVLAIEVGGLDVVFEAIVGEMSWYEGDHIEIDGKREPVMVRPAVRPLAP